MKDKTAVMIEKLKSERDALVEALKAAEDKAAMKKTGPRNDDALEKLKSERDALLEALKAALG